MMYYVGACVLLGAKVWMDLERSCEVASEMVRTIGTWRRLLEGLFRASSLWRTCSDGGMQQQNCVRCRTIIRYSIRSQSHGVYLRLQVIDLAFSPCDCDRDFLPSSGTRFLWLLRQQYHANQNIP
jgi:hypothetical protein